MSRGLGRLQRFIKEQVHRADREYRTEADALEAAGGDDEPKGRFWLTWPDIRSLIEENPDFNRGPYRIAGPGGSIRPMQVGPSGPIPEISASLERSAKRALYLLVKRGEIVQIQPSERHYLTRYITKDMDQQLRETGKAIMEGFARMAKEETSEL
jgi:hypothetical protein